MEIQAKDFAAILADKKAKLSAETAEKLNNMELEYGAIGAIYNASGVEMNRGHIYPYNGRTGTLSLDLLDTYGKPLGTREQVAALLAAFPPVATEYVTDSWKHRTILPAGQTKYGNNEIVDREDVYGIFATVDHNTYHTQGPTVKFEWYAVVNGNLWEINVKRSLHSVNLGTSNFRATRYDGGQGPIKNVTSNSYSAHYGGATRTYGSGSADSAGNIEIRYALDSEAASFTCEQWAAVIIKD